ncbi:MAG: hypothetical protein ACO1SV_12310 [Fimbriimonas sp.]
MNRSRLWAFRAFAPNDGGAGGGAGGSSGGAGGGTGGGTGNNGGAGVSGGATATWETVYGALPDDQKALFDTHISGLKNALSGERAAKGDLEKQLREAASKAEKGSAAEKQLTDMADKMKAGEKQAAFYETIGAAGVKNLRLAWAAASGDAKYWKNDGSLILDDFKKDFPELFGAPAAGEAHAGAGAGQSGGGKPNMNDFIRRGAGKG